MGFFAELTLSEAIALADKKIKTLEVEVSRLTDQACQVRRN